MILPPHSGTENTRAFGYIRVSTLKQELGPEAQKRIITDYAERHGLNIEMIFADKGVSAKIPLSERPGGRDMAATVQRGDHVIIAKLDRAFRRLSDCAAHLEKWESMQLRIHICDMGGVLDMSSPIGRFMAHIIAAFAEFERNMISIRTKEGLSVNAERRRKANLLRHPGYGWEPVKTWDATNKMYVWQRHPSYGEREDMKEIVRLRREGFAWKDIYFRFNKQGRMTRRKKEWTINRLRLAAKAQYLTEMEALGMLSKKEGEIAMEMADQMEITAEDNDA